MSNQPHISKNRSIIQHQIPNLKEEFAYAGLVWPPKKIYIRVFKLDRILEVWVCDNSSSKSYKYFKSYPICVLSGHVGTKNYLGDKQVPEGFYHISSFNPFSHYDLALGINYPNASDILIHNETKAPLGGNIFIHGGCASVGCIPIMDNNIEELYTLTLLVHTSNPNNVIPVHIFPYELITNKFSDQVDRVMLQNPKYFNTLYTLQKVYDYFNEYRHIPPLFLNTKGYYDVKVE
ncbi:MAG: L,D-transpeptidase family protein [Phycisphaerales bacterium]|nr:L,D-transpeptidase family protein [Phycisphaerales bacterium]